MFSYSSDLEPVNPATRAEQRGEGASFQINTLTSLPVRYSTWLTYYVTDFSGPAPLWSKQSQTCCLHWAWVQRKREATGLVWPQEGGDAMEEGRGWYWERNGQQGEGESWASCLFNIFILISALGTQRRIHPENWIISLRWVKHT